MAIRTNLGHCQVEGCNEKAKYGLYRTDSKDWLHVCPLHEGVIGSENQRRAGGYYQKGKAKGGDR